MRYWTDIALPKPNVVPESEEEARGLEEYFEMLPEVQVYLDAPIADEPWEEYVIKLFEWGTDQESEDLDQVGASKTPTELVGA
jgi:hypothetical protein